MKGFLFSILLFSAFSIKAQVLQRSQGFPADPVTALSWCDDTLYIGTQGSGVFVLVEQRILPSRRFKEFSRSTIYKFQDCEPVASGTLQAYPITASSPDGSIARPRFSPTMPYIPGTLYREPERRLLHGARRWEGGFAPP